MEEIEKLFQPFTAEAIQEIFEEADKQAQLDAINDPLYEQR